MYKMIAAHVNEDLHTSWKLQLATQKATGKDVIESLVRTYVKNPDIINS